MKESSSQKKLNSLSLITCLPYGHQVGSNKDDLCNLHFDVGGRGVLLPSIL